MSGTGHSTDVAVPSTSASADVDSEELERKLPFFEESGDSGNVCMPSLYMQRFQKDGESFTSTVAWKDYPKDGRLVELTLFFRKCRK